MPIRKSSADSWNKIHSASLLENRSLQALYNIVPGVSFGLFDYLICNILVHVTRTDIKGSVTLQRGVTTPGPGLTRLETLLRLTLLRALRGR